MLATAYNGTVKQATRNVQIVLQNLLHNELNSDVQSALSLSLVENENRIKFIASESFSPVKNYR